MLWNAFWCISSWIFPKLRWWIPLHCWYYDDESPFFVDICDQSHLHLLMEYGLRFFVIFTHNGQYSTNACEKMICTFPELLRQGSFENLFELKFPVFLLFDINGSSKKFRNKWNWSEKIVQDTPNNILNVKKKISFLVLNGIIAFGRCTQ